MRLIAVTRPDFYAEEPLQIVSLLKNGFEKVHVRKPESRVEDMTKLLDEIPMEYREKLVLHDHHELAETYGVKGVHLNQRNPLPPADFKGSLSASCHSLEEIPSALEHCDYVFLSPIFDSISKAGYQAKFTVEELEKADLTNVFALGGVTFDKIPELRKLGFTGAALHGALWHKNS